MIEAIEYLYNTIYDIWLHLINVLMLDNSWDNPSHAYNNIIDGELIKINLTWSDLSSVLTVFSVCLLIYLFIKFFVKLLGVFVWK